MKPLQLLRSWNCEMIPQSKGHGSLDSATDEPVLLARCPRGDLSVRRESNFTWKGATARAMRNLFQPLRTMRSCYLSVTARDIGRAMRSHIGSIVTLWRAGLRPLCARAVQPLSCQAARLAGGAVACRALDAIEQYAVPRRRVSSGSA